MTLSSGSKQMLKYGMKATSKLITRNWKPLHLPGEHTGSLTVKCSMKKRMPSSKKKKKWAPAQIDTGVAGAAWVELFALSDTQGYRRLDDFVAAEAKGKHSRAKARSFKIAETGRSCVAKSSLKVELEVLKKTLSDTLLRTSCNLSNSCSSELKKGNSLRDSLFVRSGRTPSDHEHMVLHEPN